MQQLSSKACADSLRAFAIKNYGIKLKPTHAHQLVSAFFGYKSQNAMLADANYPITNLAKAEIIVMVSDDFIDRRREDLQDLSPELPDSYKLGEPVYDYLLSGEWWISPYPPFRDYQKLARFLVENNDAYQEAFKFYREIPLHHFVEVNREDDGVLLTVVHAHETDTGEMLGNGETSIKLPRVAAHIGFGKPRVSVGQWSGGARRKITVKGAQS